VNRLRVCVLGQFSASVGSGQLALGPSEARLLACLALHYPAVIQRPRVAGILWAESTEERARANLSTARWRLASAFSKQGLPTAVIISSKDSVGLESRLCEVDLADFRKNSASSVVAMGSPAGLVRAAECARLYRGDLLEDWDVEWCRLEREELRQRYLHTIRALSDAFEQRGRLDLALAYTRRAAEADPLNEVVQRNLIRLLHRSGNRASAVAQFNLFARLCRSELGIEPDPETMALRGILNPPSGDVASGAPSGHGAVAIRLERAPIIGRAAEKAVITRLMDSTIAGNGGSILLLGDVGIGKSRLADWAVEEWAGRGGVLGQGRCIEFNEPVPYQPVLDALSQLIDAKDLGELFRQHPGATHRDENRRTTVNRGADAKQSWLADRTWLFARLLACLEQAATERPLLVVVEDMQWADAGTLDFLSYVLGHVRSTRLGVVLTTRSVGDRQSCRNAERVARNCTFVLHLAPLSRGETAELAQFLLDRTRLPGDLSDWLHDETEGNPLFVVETVRLLQQRGYPSTSVSLLHRGASDLRGRAAPSKIPEGVRLAVEQRLALLQGATHRVAQIASVLGRSFSEELLDMLVEMSGSRLSRAVVQLIMAGIFERDGGGYRFAHDKIRAVCYESLSLKSKRAYHARTAAVLAQMPGVPIQSLAWHQHSACQWRLATASWELAGDRAKEVYAFEEAASAYRRALSCLQKDKTTDSSRPIQPEALLLFKLDEVLANHGNPADWNAVLDRLGELCRRSARKDLIAAWYLRRAVHQEHIGNFSLAASLARRAWFLAKSAADATGEVEALRILAWVLNRGGRHDRSMLVSKLALARIGDSRPPSLVSTLWQAAAAHLKRSRYQSAAAFLERAEAIALDLGLRRELHHIAALRAIGDKWTGRIVASRAGFLRALELASEACDQVGIARASFHLATLDVLRGDLGAGLRRLRKAILTSRSVGYTRTQLACLNEVAYGIGRILGNHTWARRALAHALRLAEGSGSSLLIAMCRDSQAALLLDEGRLSEALAVINHVLQLLQCQRGSIGPNQESLARRGAILLRMGRLEDAVRDLEQAGRVQAEMGDHLILVDTLTYLAMAYAKKGETNRAQATSEEALRTLAENDYASMQPQRVFWHHFLILEGVGRQPRMHYLERAVKSIEGQASTLSSAQRLRFCRQVALNQTILETWDTYNNAVKPALGVRSQAIPPSVECMMG